MGRTPDPFISERVPGGEGGGFQRARVAQDRGPPLSKFANILQGMASEIQRDEARIAERERVAKQSAFIGNEIADLSEETFTNFVAETDKSSVDGFRPEGFTNNRLAEFDRSVNDRAARIEDNETRDKFLNRATGIRNKLLGQSLKFESVALAAVRKEDFNETVLKYANTVSIDPDSYTAMKVQLEEDIASREQFMPATDMPALADSARAMLANSFIEALIREKRHVEAKELIKAGEFDEFMDPKDTRRHLAAAQTKEDEVNQLARYHMDTTLKNNLAGISLNGKEQNPVSATDVIAAYGPKVGPVRWAQYQKARDLSTDVHTVRQRMLTATPEEIDRMVAEFKPNRSAEDLSLRLEAFEKLRSEAELIKDVTEKRAFQQMINALPTMTPAEMDAAVALWAPQLQTTPDDLRDRLLKTRDMVADETRQDQMRRTGEATKVARAKDPAGFAIGASDDVKQHWQAFQANSTDASAYVESTMAIQAKWGSRSPRLLPTAYRDRLVAGVESTPPDQLERMLMDLRNKFLVEVPGGTAWDLVVNELREGKLSDMHHLATMYLGTRAFNMVTATLSADPTDVKRQVNVKTPDTAVAAAVAGVLEPYRKASLSGIIGVRDDEFVNFAEAVEQITYSLMHSQGYKEKQAAQLAYDVLITDHMHIEKTYVVPKVYEGRPTDLTAIQSMASQMKSAAQLDIEDLVLPTTFSGQLGRLDEDQRRPEMEQTYREALASGDAFWVTTGNHDGLQLVLRLQTGEILNVLVRDDDNQPVPYGFTWDEAFTGMTTGPGRVPQTRVILR